MHIFVSVGTGLNPQQEAFVAAVEDRLKAGGLTPCTIGRNTFSADAPLRAVDDLMNRCVGCVVIAVERYHFSDGIERRGSGKQRPIGSVSLATPWNQIEAALAYGRKLPLLVIVDETLRCDGLLEKGNDWYVLEMAVDPAALATQAFVGVMANWRDQVNKRAANAVQAVDKPLRPDPALMTIGQLLAGLRPSQLWATLGALAATVGGAFLLGARLGGG